MQQVVRSSLNVRFNNSTTSNRVPAARRSISHRSRSPLVVRADFTDVINDLTVAINKNTALSEGKKALAKFQAGQYDSTAINAQLDQLIAENPVVVFSFTTCPFCVKAKKVLDDLNVKYVAVECDQIADGKAYRAELAQRTNRTSMPNIFIGTKGIGGCNDGPGLITLQKNGELIPLLQSAGAL